jgi:hypothetical protein
MRAELISETASDVTSQVRTNFFPAFSLFQKRRTFHRNHQRGRLHLLADSPTRVAAVLLYKAEHCS